MDNNSVTFSYKDYRHGSVKKEMTLEAMEFVRRFYLHILPKGFVRIRHFGILSSSSKKETIPAIKAQVPEKALQPVEARVLTAYNTTLCPCCKTNTMVILEVFHRRGPPKELLTRHTQ